ncbi:hypothetical protein BPOR_0650g00050 [Botrytis porri]|uniref:Uncharacterized protein n=1 Tax=Botrytis porri TaxID=87229 RepID=A0A4Z1KDG5_9HELO|nr:hypothetical protein BPOR_0650g00050 [Botrytis porri]
MASTIFSGNANRGLQAGTINGPVNAEFYHYAPLPPGIVESSNTVQAVLSVATGIGMAQTIVARKKAKFRDGVFRRWALFDFASSEFLT